MCLQIFIHAFRHFPWPRRRGQWPWLFHRPHQVHGHFPHPWNFIHNPQKLLYLSGWSWRSGLPTDSHTSPPPPPTSRGNDKLITRLWSGPPLMRCQRGLNVHKNIPVSVTKLMLSLRVGFISSHLTADKLFPVNPKAITGPLKMSLLLEGRGQKHACIDHQTEVYPCYTPWLVHNVQQAGKDVHSKTQQDCQKAKCYASQFPYCTTDSIPIDFIVLMVLGSGKLSYSQTSVELPEPSKFICLFFFTALLITIQLLIL